MIQGNCPATEQFVYQLTGKTLTSHKHMGDMIQMKALNRTQLKLIAICAMVCDHLAWGFLDFYTPLAQILHIIGRLTIPIMCFFIAEGYRHTSNLRRYIHRMICFWLISILPFYLFFGDMYEYRQNIIFDLLLGLCTLTVLNASTLKKWKKVLLTAAIFFLSAAVGGWPVMPILFILIFYYLPDFKKQALWICTLTVLLVIFLAVTSSLNQTYHFCHYSWMWYDRLYMLGFMLSLLFLKHYNREKGQTPFTSYFFYIFYPAHFLLLYLVQKMIAGVSAEQIYTCMFAMLRSK